MADELTDAALDEQVARALKWKKQGNAWFTPQGFYFGLSPRLWSIDLNAALELWAGTHVVDIQIWQGHSPTVHLYVAHVKANAPTGPEAARLLTEAWVEMKKEEKGSRCLRPDHTH